MCIAILNTKGVTLKKELLNNCWLNNTDGAGMLYVKDKKMQVFKEMKSFDTFYQEYLRIRKDIPKQNIVLHFRISTHGKVNETNCHPFLVHDELGFVHNGMIYNAPKSSEYSDTFMFNESILKYMIDGFEYNEHLLDMIEDYIGVGSKLLFLNSNDDYTIVNEKAGHWNLGCWFSNSSYKQVNDWVDYGGVKKQKSATTTKWSGYGYGYGFYDNHDDFFDAEPVRDNCSDCDSRLYGINESERGVCNDCYASANDDLLDEGTCAYCECEAGPYNSTYRDFLCASCYWELEGEELLTPEESHRLYASSKDKDFHYDRELNILECETENGVFYYDNEIKLWLKKSASLGA